MPFSPFNNSTIDTLLAVNEHTKKVDWWWMIGKQWVKSVTTASVLSWAVIERWELRHISVARVGFPLNQVVPTAVRSLYRVPCTRRWKPIQNNLTVRMIPFFLSSLHSELNTYTAAVCHPQNSTLVRAIPGHQSYAMRSSYATKILQYCIVTTAHSGRF